MPDLNGIYLNEVRWDVLEALADEAKKTRIQFAKSWIEDMLDEAQGKNVATLNDVIEEHTDGDAVGGVDER